MRRDSGDGRRSVGSINNSDSDSGIGGGEGSGGGSSGGGSSGGVVRGGDASPSDANRCTLHVDDVQRILPGATNMQQVVAASDNHRRSATVCIDQPALMAALVASVQELNSTVVALSHRVVQVEQENATLHAALDSSSAVQGKLLDRLSYLDGGALVTGLD
jgi:hypothetical protein